LHSQVIEEAKSTVLKVIKTGDGVNQISITDDLLYLTKAKAKSPLEG